MGVRGVPALREAFAPLVTKVKRAFNDRIALDDLRSEYIDVFDRGRQVTSLYETEYGRERAMVKGPQLVDIAAFYRSFGFETGGEGVQAEMIDHVSVELEFYALLCLKYGALERRGDSEGMDVVLDGRRKFLRAHLARFIGAVADRPGVQASPYFSSVFEYCKALVMSECDRLGVEVEAESWLAPPVEAEEMSCGGSVGAQPC
jgi:TorA maturation chaperone TorD